MQPQAISTSSLGLKYRWLTLSLTLLFAVLMCGNLQAQQSTSGSSNESWGYYRWQVDQGTSTTTFTADATFERPAGSPQIPIPIRHPTTIRHVHGTVSLWVPKAKVNGSIAAIVRDQSGNAIAAVKMQQFGVATATVPISATLSTPLPVTSLQLLFCVDLPGVQVVYMSFAMD